MRPRQNAGAVNTAPSAEVRKAASEALFELSDRLMRGATSLTRKAALLLSDDPKTYGRAAAELTRYHGFDMPAADKVLEIAAALEKRTFAESKKLAEKRWRQRRKEKEEREKSYAASCFEGHKPGGYSYNDGLNRLLQAHEAIVPVYRVLNDWRQRPSLCSNPEYVAEAMQGAHETAVALWAIINAVNAANKHNMPEASETVVPGPWGTA